MFFSSIITNQVCMKVLESKFFLQNDYRFTFQNFAFFHFDCRTKVFSQPHISTKNHVKIGFSGKIYSHPNLPEYFYRARSRVALHNSFIRCFYAKKHDEFNPVVARYDYKPLTSSKIARIFFVNINYHAILANFKRFFVSF